MFDWSAKQIHEFDQKLEEWFRTIPPFLKSLYDGFIAAGFDKDQSLNLTEYMYSSIVFRANLPKADPGSQNDNPQ